MAHQVGERDVMVEDATIVKVPLKTISTGKPKMNLQQAVRDGREPVLRQWLAGLSESKKKAVIDAKDSFGFAAMHYAARFNRFKMMQLLVTNEADAEILTDEGLTPLHYAARYTPLYVKDSADDEAAPVTLHSTSRQILQILINLCCVDINAKDNDGVTPLHLACMRGNRAAVELLMGKQIIVDIQDKKLDTPLHSACLYGEIAIVELLLSKGADCLVANHERALPLHVACDQGFVDIVKLIMRLRFEFRAQMIEATDNDYNTPLHLACNSGNVEVVKVLLLNGADPSACKLHDVTSLHIAAKKGFINIADVLLQDQNSDVNVPNSSFLSPLHFAAQFNQVKMIKFLLEKGADMESQDVDSYTPLLTAGSYGQLEAMDTLVKAGAFTDDVDRDGKSIVFIAAEEDQVELLKSMILGDHVMWGLSLVSTSDSNHNTPLHIASKNGNIESVKILLKACNFKIDARNDAAKTPLHLAAAKGHANVINEITRYAEQCGIDVAIDEDDDGNTPLHLACSNGNYAAAKALILADADPEVRNSRQWTPMDCCAFSGQENIVQLLLDAEVEVDPKDIRGATPLQLACKEGHIKVVDLLIKNGAKVSHCNSAGLNALDVAVESGQKDVAMAIVKCDQWTSALRNVTKATNVGIDAPLDRSGYEMFTTPLRRIINKMPDVAEVVFNRCCYTNEDVVSIDDPDYKIEFKYEFLEDFRVMSTFRNRRRRTKHPLSDNASTIDELDDKNTIIEDTSAGFQTTWGPTDYSRKNHCLHILAHSKSIELLKHPLAANLLHYKWLKYGQLLYFSNLFIYIVFVIFLTAFALSSLSPTSETCMQVLSGLSANCTEEISESGIFFVPIGAAFVILFAIVKLGFETIQLLKFRFQYLLDWVNYLEIILFVFSILFVFVFTEDCFCPHPWQWQLGAIAVFLGWIDLVIFIRKLPITGIYVVMFMNIFYIFLKLAFLAFLLILAFSFSFHMLFNDPSNTALGIRTPFTGAWRSIVKTMTMTTGEFEFDNIFRQNGGANSPDLQFPAVSYILWILFLILMPILLTNLLVGLAVDDIKGMQESASINRLALRVELTLTVEEYLPLWLRRKLIVGNHVIYPNRKLKPFQHFFYNVLGLFRVDSAENIKNALNAPPEPIQEVREQNRRLAQQVDNLRNSMDAIREQNEQLMAIVTDIAENQGMAVPSGTRMKPSRNASPSVPPMEKLYSQTSFI